MDIARTLFLVNATKSEYPTVVEVNYNVVECENDQPSVKNEAMDLDYVDVNPQKEPKKAIKKPIETLKRQAPVLQAPDITGKLQQMSSPQTTPSETHTLPKPSGYQLISDMLNMPCFYCSHITGFSSWDEMTEHYDNEHSENGSLQIECCATKMEIKDFMDHLGYHRNPDKFK